MTITIAQTVQTAGMLPAGLLRTIYEIAGPAPFFLVGLALLLAAVGLSILNGLIELAFYIALAGGSLLVVAGVVGLFFPELIPFATGTSVLQPG